MLQKTNAKTILDDLLYRWHEFARAEQICKGYSKCAAGCGSSLTSKQYDTETTTYNDDVDRSQVIEFDDYMLKKLYHDRPMFYAAICQDARNIWAGSDVFRSPRLPQGQAGRDIVTNARLYIQNNFLGIA